MTTLLVGNTTLTMDEVSTSLLETTNVIQSTFPSHRDALATREDSRTSLSSKERCMLKGRYYNRDDHFISRSRDDIECFYCHKKTHH